MKMSIGLFDSVPKLNAAIDELHRNGVPYEDMSIITREDIIEGDAKIKNDLGDRVKSGAKTGGAIGGVLGLLAGVGALAIPGVGALFVAGPIATALGITGVAGATASGALTGALAGGIVGALSEIGIDERRAKEYEDAIKSGSMLLAVGSPDNTDDEETVESDDVVDVMEDNGANSVGQYDVKMEYR